MTKLTRNDNGTWWGYLWRWGDSIPERPGHTFKQTDRFTINMAALQGSDLVGAKGRIINIIKANEAGALAVIQSDDDLTDYDLGYTLTSYDEIEDERPYDAISGEVGYRLRKYPIQSIVVRKVDTNASTNVGPVTASVARPKRTGRPRTA